jgi:hypothetical protein
MRLFRRKQSPQVQSKKNPVIEELEKALDRFEAKAPESVRV